MASEVTARAEEQKELKTLNDRFETYVAHSRTLRHISEIANARVESVHESFASLEKKLESHYRAQIDGITKQLEKEMDLHAASKNKITDLESDLANATSLAGQVPAMSKDIAALQVKLRTADTDATAQRARADKLDANLRADRVILADVTRKLKEAETRIGVLSTEHSAARDEVSALRAERKGELEARRSQDDPARVQAMLMEARQEVVELHKGKEKEIEARMRKEFAAEMKVVQEKAKSLSGVNEKLRTDLSRASLEVTSQKEFNNELLKRITTIEDLHKRDIDASNAERVRLEGLLAIEIDRGLKRDEEFNELQGQNITLQAEIDHYARLLTSEELDSGLTHSPASKKARMDESGAGSGSGKSTTMTPKSTGKGKGKAASAGKKRDREEETAEGVPSDYNEDLDLQADKVPVFNRMDDAVNLKGWTLQAGTDGPIFEFPDMTLQPNTSVTVWSGPDAVGKVNPPTDIMWSKKYIWSSEGDTATLYEPSGRMVAKVAAERASRYDSSDLEVVVDLEAEEVLVTNKSKAAISLSSWYLSSDIGGQKFTFPKGINLAAGKTLTVLSGPGADAKASAAASFLWTRRSVWNNKADSATLYDPKNRRVSRVAGQHHEAIVAHAPPSTCTIM